MEQLRVEGLLELFEDFGRHSPRADLHRRAQGLGRDLDSTRAAVLASVVLSTSVSMGSGGGGDVCWAASARVWAARWVISAACSAPLASTTTNRALHVERTQARV